jgi:hypothetical protein
MLNPEEMLKTANLLPNGDPVVNLENYGSVIHVLITKKKFTMKEVQGWLKGQGISYSTGAIHNNYKMWKLKADRIELNIKSFDLDDDPITVYNSDQLEKAATKLGFPAVLKTMDIEEVDG